MSGRYERDENNNTIWVDDNEQVDDNCPIKANTTEQPRGERPLRWSPASVFVLTQDVQTTGRGRNSFRAIKEKIGLFLQFGFTVAYLIFFFSNLSVLEDLVLDSLLGISWSVGGPAIVIGIISLLFRRKSGSSYDMRLIIFIDVVISIWAIVSSRRSIGGLFDLIAAIIISFGIFSISAIPGFIMSLQED